jgi:hypothetical protein
MDFLRTSTSGGKIMRKSMLLGLLLVPVWTFAEDAAKDEAAPAPKGDITVIEAKLGTGMQDRKIQGEAEEFKADVGKVYCFTRIKGAEGQELSHVWYQGDKKVSEVKLSIKSALMRTWSYKSIGEDGKGDWRVDVVGPDGAVLKSLSFKIVE